MQFTEQTWKPAEGSHGLQCEAGEALRLEEKPGEVVLSMKTTCCETAAWTEQDFPALLLASAAHSCSSTWALTTAPCGHAACWGAPGPHVGCLSGSKVRGSLSHYKSLLGDSSRLDPCKAVVKLHPSCWGMSCYCQHAVDEVGPWWNQLQTLSDGAGPGSLLVLLIVPQWRKNPYLLLWKVPDLRVTILNFQC